MVALVIGNAGYSGGGALKNPVHDAEDIVAKLKSYGFDVITVKDAPNEAMDGTPLGAVSALPYIIQAIDHRTLDRHRDAAVTGHIPALSCRQQRSLLRFLHVPACVKMPHA